MLEILNKYGYNPPLIKEGDWGKFKITKNESSYYYLIVDGVQKMSYDIQTHDSAYQFFSHYKLAKGHVAVTGMGFGSRENWILSKKEVKKLTIIEKYPELIEFHKEVDSLFLKDKRVEILIMDASDYDGKSDVLLLDHYEFESYEEILTNVKKIQDQSKCNFMWFWPFERIIMHSRKWHTLNDKDLVNSIGVGYNNKMVTKYQAFNLLKDGWGLNKIPNIDEQTLNLYCMMFNSYLFSNSEAVFNTHLIDKKYEELYKYF